MFLSRYCRIYCTTSNIDISSTILFRRPKLMLSRLYALKEMFETLLEEKYWVGMHCGVLLFNEHVLLLYPRNVLGGQDHIGCHCGKGLCWTTRISIISTHHIGVANTYWSRLHFPYCRDEYMLESRPHHIVVVDTYWSHLSSQYCLAKTYWSRLRHSIHSTSGNTIHRMHWKGNYSPED